MQIGSTAPVSLWHAPLIALSTGDAVVVWLFTRALLDDTFVPRWWHALIWALVSAYSFVSCLWIAPAVHGRPAIIAVNLIALCFIVLALAQTVTSWSADLVERRRHVRVFIVGATVLYGGVNALLGISIWGRDTAVIANVVNAAVLTGIVAAICYAMMRVNAAGSVSRARRSRRGRCRPGRRGRRQRRGPAVGARVDAVDGGRADLSP